MRKKSQPLHLIRSNDWQRRQFLKLPLALSCMGLTMAWAQQGQSKTPQDWPEVKIAMIEGFSGPFGNAGDAAYRNLLLATERVNMTGGVMVDGRPHRLSIVRLDSQGSVQGALTMLKAATDQKIRIIMQGNSSAVAISLISAIDKHNARNPDERVVFLNYSAVETTLTNELCSFWHFRFDAHADMRLKALLQVLKEEAHIKKVYLIGQDYSFGRYVQQRAREMLFDVRPDIEIAGQTLHPMGQVKDFIPYASKIKASGAQTIITGNWGNDLSLLVRATRDIGMDAHFYTFYANDLGAPTAMGDAGVGRAVAVTEWHPNAGVGFTGDARNASDAFYHAFTARFPKPQDDFIRLRMHIMVEMLAKAITDSTQTRQVDAFAIASALEDMHYESPFHSAYMRKEDHQLQQPLYVARMEKAGSADVPFAIEGSPYGFRTLLRLEAEQVQMPQTCKMQR